MPLDYSSASRTLQDQHETRRLADRLAEIKVHDSLTQDDRQFIEARDMFFLATVDATGQPTCSYKGGDPGFVRVLSDRTIVFPNYDGNGMYLSMGNVQETGAVGLLFIDFSQQRRIRVEGLARLCLNHPLLAQYAEAQFLIEVEIARVYPNCPRYIHQYQLVERSSFVPHAGTETPIPGWKRTAWAADVLPANDRARETNA